MRQQMKFLAEAGNYSTLQRLYGANYGWPYSPQPSAAAAAAAMAALNPMAASSVDLYYRQAALQKPLAYRLFPPGLPLLPLPSDSLRTGLEQPDLVRPDILRPELLRPDILRFPEAFRGVQLGEDKVEADEVRSSDGGRSPVATDLRVRSSPELRGETSPSYFNREGSPYPSP